MTGTLITKKLKSGKSYYYVKLSFKDPVTGTWRQKLLGTGLETKGNKRKAEAMIQSFIAEYEGLEKSAVYRTDGVYPNVSMSEYATAWISDKRIDGIQSSTAETYDIRIKHIKSYFDDKGSLVKDITPYDVDRFIKHLLKSGKRNQKTGILEPLSPRTVADIKVILSKILDQAVIDGIIATNPAKFVKVNGKKKKAYEAEMFFLTEAECRDFIAFLAKSADPEMRRLAPIAFIAIYYGLRRGEILGLKWSAIDKHKKLVNICHTIVRIKQTHAKDSVKTNNSRRSLALFSGAEGVFDKIKSEQEANKDYFGNAYLNKEGYVFTWEDGHSYDPSTISDKFKKALGEFGRPELSLHKLRHTCASLLIDKGWDPKRVQYWMGHADIQTTLNIYAHYDKAKINSSAIDLDSISNGCADLI